MEAVMERARLIADARTAGLRPGEMPQNSGSPQNTAQGDGQGKNSPEVAFNLDEFDLKSKSLLDWIIELPPKVAEELIDRQRESFSPEFRKPTHYYFLTVGERGRARQVAPKKK